MKKLIALSLALLMLLGLFTGCNKVDNTPEEPKNNSAEAAPSTENKTEPKEELEPVTLTWYLPTGAVKSGTEDVFEAFNKKLAEVLPNTTVEFIFHPDLGTNATNFPLLMSAETPVDLYWLGFVDPVYQYAVDGYLTSFTPYINENTPNLLAEQKLWSVDYNSITLDGELYGIPCIQPRVTEAQGLRLEPAISKYLDVEAFTAESFANLKLTEKMLDLLEEAIQKAVDAGEFDDVVCYTIPGDMCTLGLRGYAPVTGTIYFDSTVDNPVPLQMWEIPEYQMMVKRMAKWYEKGWILEEQLIGVEPEGRINLIATQYDYNQTWQLANEFGVFQNASDGLDQRPKDIYLLNKPEDGFVGLANFGSASTYNVVPFTSENPERAVMLLDVLRGEPGTIGNDLLNMLVYGFAEGSAEAEEYGWYSYQIVDEDGQDAVDISFLGEEQSPHSVVNWLMGNTYKILHSKGDSMTSAANKEYCMGFYENVAPNQRQTPLANCFVDTAPVSDELAAMQAVVEEYNTQIVNGCIGNDIDTVMNAAIEKIYDAGFETVKAELQAQFDSLIG